MDNTSKALSHFGVIGMKWGVRRAERAGGTYSSRRTNKLTKRASLAKESAKEWDEIAKYQGQKGAAKAAQAKTAEKAEKIQQRTDRKVAKYKQNAKEDRADSKIYDTRAKRSQTVDDIRKNAVKTTKLGHELIANILSDGTYSIANKKSRDVLRRMNTKGKRTAEEEKAMDFVDKWLIGTNAAEAREARKYIYD